MADPARIKPAEDKSEKAAASKGEPCKETNIKNEAIAKESADEKKELSAQDPSTREVKHVSRNDCVQKSFVEEKKSKQNLDEWIII